MRIARKIPCIRQTRHVILSVIDRSPVRLRVKRCPSDLQGTRPPASQHLQARYLAADRGVSCGTPLASRGQVGPTRGLGHDEGRRAAPSLLPLLQPVGSPTQLPHSTSKSIVISHPTTQPRDVNHKTAWSTNLTKTACLSASSPRPAPHAVANRRS